MSDYLEGDSDSAPSLGEFRCTSSSVFGTSMFANMLLVQVSLSTSVVSFKFVVVSATESHTLNLLI